MIALHHINVTKYAKETNNKNNVTKNLDIKVCIFVIMVNIFAVKNVKHTPSVQMFANNLLNILDNTNAKANIDVWNNVIIVTKNVHLFFLNNTKNINAKRQNV